VVDGSHRPGLAAEALEPLRIVGLLGWQQLERDLATELRIFRLVDHAHAALAEHAGDLVSG